ncbi:wax ester/triacylglycerol synthase family O-acyltransferase [Ideonella sp. YS5]|uniref:wax ester/triacylglycerol synthase family O-acyltransferase n=1 Tax=Ideonella sp. YS5 TaxID=3453714 RepID=UPI003EEE06A5
MAQHAMSPVDAAWYHIDGPANPAVVNALVTTRKPLDFERVKAVFDRRLARFGRFRQRVVEPALGMPRWEDVDDFEIGHHMHHLALPAPGDEAALRALAADLASAPLPGGRPLWQAYVIDGVGEGGALVMRYHHCIGDGQAMMTVAASLFDTSPGRRSLPLTDTDPPPAPPPGLLATAFDLVTHPQRVAQAAAQLVDGGRVLVQDLLKPRDPDSPFKGEFGTPQRVAWSKPVAVDELKAIGWPFGAKVNDVLVSALAGALRSYLAHRGVAVAHTTLRAMVPVNLRPPERAQALGNEFGLVILDLPLGERDAVRRVALAKARMDALKRSTEPLAMEWLFDLFGRGPKAVEDLAQTMFGSKASLVLTNVAGPRQPLYLAGAAIERMVFWVPHPGDEMGLGVSFMSYRGQVQLGVIADARLVPDPEAIAAAFDAEVATLARRYARAAEQREALRQRSLPKPVAAARTAAASRHRRAT